MMKAGIIAIGLALAALGLAGFATFAALDDDNPTPTAPIATSWSQEECEILKEGQAKAESACTNIPVGGPFPGDCSDFISITKAINDNCD